MSENALADRLEAAAMHEIIDGPTHRLLEEAATALRSQQAAGVADDDGALRSRSEAWHAVVTELRQHIPDFMDRRNTTGKECAVLAIRELAERAASPAPAVPQGMKLVPVEPTIDMENAGDKADRDYSNNRFHGKGHLGRVAFIYDAMLSASPREGGK